MNNVIDLPQTLDGSFRRMLLNNFEAAIDIGLEIVDRIDVPPKPPLECGSINRSQIGRNLYIMLEVAARDLPHRAKLAGDAARAGFNVLIGASWSLGAHRFLDLPPGIVLLKSANAIDRGLAVCANQAHHKVAVMNEELFALAPESWLYELEIDPTLMQYADLVMAHGQESATLMRELFPAARVVDTGTPRAVPCAIERIADNIVVCGMAGTVNNVVPLSKYAQMACRVLGKGSNSVMRLFKQQVVDECTSLPIFTEIVSALRGEFGNRVIARPHPLEDARLYCDSIEHDPMPFTERLKTAAVVIFVSGCATGLEAVLHGVPAIRIGYGGHGISRQLGVHVGNKPMDVIAQVREYLSRRVEQHVPSNHFSADTTVAALLNTAWFWHRKEYDQSLPAAISRRPAPFFPNEFQAHKMPDIDTSKVEAYSRARVQKVGWNLWHLPAA